MSAYALDFIIKSCQGRKLGQASPIIKQIIIDSRQEINTNTLFIALEGDRFDGHDFVAEVLSNGASVAIVSSLDKLKTAELKDKVLILVEDTLQALQQIAKAYRQEFKIPLVAITGSVGKTTTKELLHHCLKTTYKTLSTKGNYNNDIGLPLTLLGIEEQHDLAVVEVAMRGLGEISRLVNIARPTCAIITNAELVHLEHLGNIDNVIKAKCEVLETLSAQDFALVNGDNLPLLKRANTYPCRIYTFGYNDDCDFKLVEISSDKTGLFITVQILQEKAKLKFPISAPKLALNIVAAIGAAYILGVPLQESISQIGSYVPTENRLQITYLPEGGILINDTYNANPLSMQAALETASNLKGNNRLVAVLGDMFELGSYEEKGHLEVGGYVVANHVDKLITIGNRAEFIAKGAIAEGMDESNIYHFPNKSESLSYLRHNLKKTDVVLFKASRGLELENLINDWLNV